MCGKDGTAMWDVADAVMRGGVVARIVTGPHDAHRQDPHLSRRYDTGRAEGGHPIEDLTAEDDLTPLPGWAPGPEQLRSMDVYRKHVCSTRP